MTGMDTSKPAVERRHPPKAVMRVVNPITRRLIGWGRLGDQLLLLHYTGRKTGRHYDVPAGYHLIDNVVSILTNSPWRHNFAAGRDVEVTLHGHRRPARALLIDDPDQVAAVYERLIADLGPARAARRLGIVINTGAVPTRAELHEAVTRSGLSIVQVHQNPPIPDPVETETNA
jgi:hypothetical protein